MSRMKKCINPLILAARKYLLLKHFTYLLYFQWGGNPKDTVVEVRDCYVNFKAAFHS